MSDPIVLVCGGYDPLHIGHVRQIAGAAKLGQVIVALNSDAWLQRKKGYIFMPWIERQEVLLALRGVTDVVSIDDEDGSCAAAIYAIQPQIFAKGGDRTDLSTLPPQEIEACESIGCRIMFGVGGAKIQSSSTLVNHLLSLQ